MQVEETDLDGVMLIKPTVFGDDRGFFMETYHADKFIDHGLPSTFVQDNHSRSSKGILRGLHFQYPSWQGKLVRVVRGEIFDVAVDLRRESANFGCWYGSYLSDENKYQLYVPEGFAHGFCVTSEIADVVYKCTSVYKPSEDFSLMWNDKDIGIEWPIMNPVLSEKDKDAVALADLDFLQTR